MDVDQWRQHAPLFHVKRGNLLRSPIPASSSKVLSMFHRSVGRPGRRVVRCAAFNPSGVFDYEMEFFQRAIDSRSRRMMFHVKHLPYRNHGRAVLRSALTATHVPPLRPDVALHATMQEGLLTRRSSSERQQAIRSRGGLLMRSRGYLSQISTDCLMGRARSRPIDFLTRVLRQHHSKRVCLMRMQHQSVAHDLSLQSTFPAVHVKPGLSPHTIGWVS